MVAGRVGDTVPGGEVRLRCPPEGQGDCCDGTCNSPEYQAQHHPDRVRKFETGADRDTDAHKIDPARALSSLVLERYSEYLLSHSVRRDGSRRDADNWKKGIPTDAYLSSLMRHILNVWVIEDGFVAVDSDGAVVDYEEALCGVLFNAMGLLHEHLKLDRETTELCRGGESWLSRWPLRAQLAR